MSLVDDARAVRKNAHAPYSNFKVGAAMVAAGETRFTEIAVIADSPTPVPPCGGCRQKLAEFAEEGATVTLATLSGETFETTVKDLLPGAFDAGHMADT